MSQGLGIAPLAPTLGRRAMSDADPLFAGPGECAALLAARDWSNHPLGPPGSWPEALRFAIRLMLDSPHPMYIWWGPELFCFYNDAYAPLAGADRHPAMIGEPGRRVWAEIWPRVGRYAERVMAGGAGIFLEDELIPITREGIRQDLWWTVSYSPIRARDAPNGVGGVLIQCAETTAAVLARREQWLLSKINIQFHGPSEQALPAVTALLGEYFGVNRCGFAEIVEAEDRITILSEYSDGTTPALSGKFSLSGFGAAWLPELRAGAAIAVRDVTKDPRTAQAAEAHLRVGTRAFLVVTLKREDGLRALLHLSHGTPRRWTAREIALAHAVAVQGWGAIEQQRTERVLRASEARLRTVFAAMPGIIFVADATGQATMVNPFYCDFVGLREADLLAAAWEDVVHPDDVVRARDVWNTAIRAGTAYRDEYRLRRADGVWRWHDARGLPVREASGAIVQWVGCCVDVHERHETANELAARVGEALAESEAARAQLHEAQKLETVGQLTAGVAHDFNNLLAAILAGAALLDKRLDTPESRRLIGGIIQAAERGAELTKRLLAFARRQELEIGPVRVAALIEDTAELLRRTLGAKILIGTALDPMLPPVSTDRNQLALALLNLAVNARDAMPDGGAITIAAHRAGAPAADPPAELAPGDYVCLSLTDTGHGMDAATLARAIEPFFTTKPPGEGTGLGLSMVHGLAAQSGGAMRLTSQPGDGTRVELWLPVSGERQNAAPEPQREPQREPLPEPPRQAPPAAARADPAKLHVLVVDDDALVGMGTAALVEDLGHRVTLVASGEAALAALEPGEARVDLIITDQIMPRMTGTELATRAHGKRPDLPVILATGYAQAPAGGPALPRLAKPFDHARLAKAIAAAMRADAG